MEHPGKGKGQCCIVGCPYSSWRSSQDGAHAGRVFSKYKRNQLTKLAGCPIRQASANFENFWSSVADHQIDGPDLNDIHNNMEQLSVLLVAYSLKAEKPNGCTEQPRNMTYKTDTSFTALETSSPPFLQTESTYYQPTAAPPSPFENAVVVFDSDPGDSWKAGDDDGCDALWAVIMKNCQNVHATVAGTYSWFTTYTQECADTRNCQKSLWLIDNNYDNNRLRRSRRLVPRT